MRCDNGYHDSDATSHTDTQHTGYYLSYCLVTFDNLFLN